MLLALVVASIMTAPSLADRVLVIQNGASPASVEIASTYRARRGVKAMLNVTVPDSSEDAAKETLDYATFQSAIEKPLALYLKTHPQIDFIVLTKGVPLRITGAPFGIGASTRMSLDSYLSGLDYAADKRSVQVTLNDSGFVGKCFFNRFWNSKERFSHAKFGGYLVTRLDGYTVADAKALIANAVASEKARPTGKFLVDVAGGHGFGDLKKVPLEPKAEGPNGSKTMNEMAYNDWDADLAVAAQNLDAAKIPNLYDKTEEFVGHKSGLMGYASWGSNDPKFVADNYKTLRFDPGAIAETAVSTSARTFLPTTGGQSLIADLISAHVTGVKGYCDEPLLQAVASPSVLFDRYTKGWTLAESFYAASRFVCWEDVVIGDPICAPYATRR